MKIVIFTAKDHIYANTIIKELLFLKKIKIAAIVESDVIYPNKNNFEGLLKYIKISGLNYVINQIVKTFIFKFGCVIYNYLPKKNTARIFCSYKRIAKENKIPIYKERDVNSIKTAKLLLDKKPDLFISILFNQIFKKNILSIPKIGIINIHPALLPKYKGVSPVFWSLANGEKITGITIHSINNQKIDQGKILAQEKINIDGKDTEHSLYLKCVKKGIPLLIETIAKIEKNGNLLFGKNRQRGSKQSYFSLPTKKAVKEFKKQNRLFFRLGEFLK